MQSVSLDIPVNSDSTILWYDNALHLLDQRLLPHQELFIRCESAADTAEAIRAMVVRGAPAIGVTAAYGIALAARQRYAQSPRDWRAQVEADMQILAGARPTAVNLFWAIAHCRGLLGGKG